MTATSTPSREVPLISPIACSIALSPVESNTGPDTPPGLKRERPAVPGRASRRDVDLQIRFSQCAVESGLRPPDFGGRRPRRPGATPGPGRLYRLRLHRALAPCGVADPDHDAVLAATDRAPADRADGRRHHQGRRPL